MQEVDCAVALLYSVSVVFFKNTYWLGVLNSCNMFHKINLLLFTSFQVNTAQFLVILFQLSVIGSP
jgi:hypothetical protein